MSVIGERSPRFQRRSDLRNFQLTERDVELLRLVYKHRFLRSTHAIELLGGSAQGILRRLQLLFQHGYLERPVFKRQMYSWGGAEPLVYSLGERGAELLGQVAAVLPRRLEWLSQRPPERHESIEHGLMVTELITRVQASCRQLGRVRFIDPDEITRELLDQLPVGKRIFRWRVNVVQNGVPGEIEVVPDQVFGLHYLDRPRSHNKTYFFLEADRGTMPVMRKDLRQSSIQKKLVGYHESWRQGVLLRKFGIQRFRVLTVTRSAERVPHLVEANRAFNSGKGSGLFLFGSSEKLALSPNLLPTLFESGRLGEVSRLSDAT
jgi:Replication-relaxation